MVSFPMTLNKFSSSRMARACQSPIRYTVPMSISLYPSVYCVRWLVCNS